jgi:hypothetical protein
VLDIYPLSSIAWANTISGYSISWDNISKYTSFFLEISSENKLISLIFSESISFFILF